MTSVEAVSADLVVAKASAGAKGRARARRPGAVLAGMRGVVDLDEVARESRLTAPEMARWVRRPRHVSLLADLASLAERRTTLLLATGRAEAASRLVALLRSEVAAKDTVRKACLDLLKLGSVPAPAPAAMNGAGAMDAEGVTAADVEAAMEKLAEGATAAGGDDADVPPGVWAAALPLGAD